MQNAGADKATKTKQNMFWLLKMRYFNTLGVDVVVSSGIF